jgi:3-oxoacyl-[acyl-carrier protein] reductase
MRFSGKTFLLLGVSRGLGYALAYFLAKDGAKVILVSRDERKLQSIKESIAGVGKVDIIVGGVSSPESAIKLKESVRKVADKLDGIAIMIGGYEEDRVENPVALDSMLNNHVKFPIYAVSAFLDLLRKGSVILLVSALRAVDKASPDQLSYAVAKAGTAKAVEILAAELLDKDIRVVGIAPSWIDGDFEPNRDWRSLRRLGDVKAPPEDFALVAAWLMSDEAQWVNGVVIPVDGGTRLRQG